MYIIFFKFGSLETDWQMNMREHAQVSVGDTLLATQALYVLETLLYAFHFPSDLFFLGILYSSLLSHDKLIPRWLRVGVCGDMSRVRWK